MQTQARPIERTEDTARSRTTWQRWGPKLAGAVAIVAVAVGTWVLLANDEPDLVVGSPLGVVQALEEATLSGNQGLERTYYADEAVLVIVSPDGEFEVRLLDPVDGDNQLSDWDGDGTIRFFDAILQDGARVYASGVSDLLSCTQTDASTVVCDELLEGSPFVEAGDHVVTQTFTVIDGLVTRHVVDLVANEAEPFGTTQVAEYEGWVRQNRPDESIEQLFPGSVGEFIVSPDTVDTHRRLIAEWEDSR